ncbi:helix-turn-helix domain-containing protein [Marinactinospora thermotolerans]|uniref:Predicted transcriptional regulators n=1 Tax=Marinactinospora thermotolerans DSM 45154 TaxID=1122192 RepID=A0A1T4PS25_9ACTN|nr:helix-turn-helix transcriptional regulator [Marinactinospora thermotolerans]SJZ94353.1 Predicted transcriptional regulators [Marinactinospora thermotolerans DSM 45154]
MSRTELGAFLVARRARLAPDDVGLASSGTRRVAGLRREEVAILAGVSVDYYTRLEQGRERHPSASVLDAVARALRLEPDARDHLFRLARVSPEHLAAPARPHVDPHLRALLDAWPDTPALLMDRRLDLLAANALGDALYADFTETDNLLRMTFLDPVGEVFFADWHRAARACVANLRLALGHDPHDRRVLALVEEADRGNPRFRELWEEHEVRGKTHEAKTFRHGAVGELTLSSHTFDVRGQDGLQLVVYRAEPGSPDQQALRLLGSLSAVPLGRTAGGHTG